MTAPLRVAVGLGDSERESRLLPILGQHEDIRIVERCLSADQLLDAVSNGRVDVVLVTYDLHRLGGSALADLDASGTPCVILVPDPEDTRWQPQRGVILPLEADADMVHSGIEAARRGEAFSPRPSGPRSGATEGRAPEQAPVPADASISPATLSVISVGSGPGSPGRTTVALNLAAALGAVQPTVLVDADLSGPSVAAYLDADPTRNIYMVAHAEPDAPWEWDRAIQSEVQPLERSRSPYADILCGVPKPDMRSRITRRFLERLVEALQRRYRYVILDVGDELVGSDAAVHRAALALGQQVLLVCSSDLVGLWRTRTTLGVLQTHLQVGVDRVALVVNRHDPRFHHARTEIEWALGAATACIVPYDNPGVQKALAAQRPLVHSRGPAARALLDFAERVHGGRLVLPPEPTREAGRRVRVPSVHLPSVHLPSIARPHIGRSRPAQAVRSEPAPAAQVDPVEMERRRIAEAERADRLRREDADRRDEQRRWDEDRSDSRRRAEIAAQARPEDDYVPAAVVDASMPQGADTWDLDAAPVSGGDGADL